MQCRPDAAWVWVLVMGANKCAGKACSCPFLLRCGEEVAPLLTTFLTTRAPVLSALKLIPTPQTCKEAWISTLPNLGKSLSGKKKPDLGMSSILDSHRTCPQLPNWSRRAFYDSQHYTPEDAKVKISGGM